MRVTNIAFKASTHFLAEFSTRVIPMPKSIHLILSTEIHEQEAEYRSIGWCPCGKYLLKLFGELASNVKKRKGRACKLQNPVSSSWDILNFGE
jgi:hypothetical protein